MRLKGLVLHWQEISGVRPVWGLDGNVGWHLELRQIRDRWFIQIFEL